MLAPLTELRAALRAIGVGQDVDVGRPGGRGPARALQQQQQAERGARVQAGASLRTQRAEGAPEAHVRQRDAFMKQQALRHAQDAACGAARPSRPGPGGRLWRRQGAGVLSGAGAVRACRAAG